MQAVAGIQDAQFRYDDPPVFVNLPVAGYAQGLLSANAAVASLYARARTGRGDRFEVSGVSALVFMESISYIRAENVTRLAGHAGPRGGIPTYRLVRGSDDWLFVGALTAPFWTNLAVAAGLEDCLIDERFHNAPMGIADMDARRELAQRVDDAFATKSARRVAAHPRRCERPARARPHPRGVPRRRAGAPQRHDGRRR